MRKVKKILISQPAPKVGKSPYYDIAEKYNLQLDFHPFIRVEGVEVKEFKQQRIAILDFTAIVFTARIAVDHFFGLCEEMKIVIPDTMMYFCASEAIALYLQKYTVYRKRKICFGATGKVEGLSSFFDKHKKEKYLVPVSETHVADLTKILDDKKLDYQKTVMYKTVSNEITEDAILSYDMLVFFSPSGITSLFENAPKFKQEERAIGCFGTSTAQAVRSAGLVLNCEAPQPDFPSMTAALESFIKDNHNHKVR